MMNIAHGRGLRTIHLSPLFVVLHVVAKSAKPACSKPTYLHLPSSISAGSAAKPARRAPAGERRACSRERVLTSRRTSRQSACRSSRASATTISAAGATWTTSRAEPRAATRRASRCRPAMGAVPLLPQRPLSIEVFNPARHGRPCRHHVAPGGLRRARLARRRAKPGAPANLAPRPRLRLLGLKTRHHPFTFYSTSTDAVLPLLQGCFRHTTRVARAPLGSAAHGTGRAS